MALIRDRVDLPVIIDADTGFGNALNAQRTMRVYERAGAARCRSRIRPSQALRAPVRQVADPGRRDGRQDRRDGRCPRLRRNPDHRAHRCRGGRGLRRRARPGGGLCGGGAMCCSSRRRAREKCAHRRAFRRPRPLCWPTWSKAAPRRSPARRPGGAGLLHRDLPRRHRPRDSEDRSGLLRQPGRQWRTGPSPTGCSISTA
jgi:hypothetical protein